MDAQKYAQEWLTSVYAQIANAPNRPDISEQDHLADAFVGDLPMKEDEHQLVLQALREMNPVKLLEMGNLGRAFYVNVFVPEEWYVENNRDMEWSEFLSSGYAPEGTDKLTF